MTDKRNRIFWLGMHVVLTKTELPRLRELGFEVFNPPYNSKIYDQSANRDWDYSQPTSLPRNVFKELSEYNFFYNRISKRIANLLNEYFGTVIVTINPDWLEQILKVYNGRIIYRIYGQPYSVSDAMWARRCFRRIQERDDFWLMPHCYETTVDEHDWLKERMRVVPYTLPLDIFDYRDTWQEQDYHKPEIMVSCPNIDNAYYRGYYNRINQYFKQPYIRIYGVQPREISDHRVVGTIPRNELLQAYQRSAGYLYLYEERNVCYLPPIEMMTVGGPIIYLPGSLLARFFGNNTVGLALDNFDAYRKLSWLIKGDQSFINDVIESQKSVKLRYAPEYVHPIFDATFKELLLTDKSVPAHPIVLSSHAQTIKESKKSIYILFHFPGSIIRFSDGEYLSAEGIPRVIRKFVEALLLKTDHQIVITCNAEQLPFVFGFFGATKYYDKLRFLVMDPEKIDPKRDEFKKLVLGYLRQLAKNALNLSKSKSFHIFWRTLQKNILSGLSRLILNNEKSKLTFLTKIAFQITRISFLLLLPIGAIAYLLSKLILLISGIVQSLKQNSAKALEILQKVDRKSSGLIKSLDVVKRINDDPFINCVIIPHYYLFPESLFLKSSTLLYLPDYTPHFFIEKFEGRKDAFNNLIGKALTRQAKLIFTNSFFTKSYLPETLLEVDTEKVRVLPIPLLVPSHKPLDATRQSELEELLEGEVYIFYPTQNRPNKQLDFLFQVFSKVREQLPDIKLVLTCNVNDYKPASIAYNSLELEDAVIFLSGASDAMLSWLYKHAAALCLTSTMEGNFPPQVFEALYFNVPVVSTKLPMITELLDEASEYLLLCEPIDLDEFVNNLLLAISEPEKVVRRQTLAYQKVLEQCNDNRFYDSVANLMNTLQAIALG